MRNCYLYLILLTALLLDAEVLLYAQASAPNPPPPSFVGLLLQMAPMFLIVFMIFHFMVIGPQKRKLQDQQKLLESLRRGEMVVTSGGIIARVGAVEKDHVVLDTGSNMKLKVERIHIAKRLEASAPEKEAS